MSELFSSSNFFDCKAKNNGQAGFAIRYKSLAWGTNIYASGNALAGVYLFDGSTFDLCLYDLIESNGSGEKSGGVVALRQSKLSFGEGFSGEFNNNSGYGVYADCFSWTLNMNRASFSGNTLGDTYINTSNMCFEINE